MTHAEIMALKAGPKTDALVAEALGGHVHEWTIKRFGPSPGWGKDWYCKSCKKWGHKFSDDPPPAKASARDPARPYSTDIAAAYEAEEALPANKRQRYAEALHDISWESRPESVSPTLRYLCWSLSHASPLARSQAQLMVLTEGDQDD